jgi:hypothetical protein
MEIALIVVLTIVLLIVFPLALMRRKTTATIDGYTVKLRRDRDFAWVVYREPSGRTLTLEAHDWLGPGNKPKVLVDFPSEIAFSEKESPPVRDGATKVDIPATPSSAMSERDTTQVQRRISEGLTRLKIQHEFTRPRRSGWTSFEDGKEIYHG